MRWSGKAITAGIEIQDKVLLVIAAPGAFLCVMEGYAPSRKIQGHSSDNFRKGLLPKITVKT
jgi:hypothetical protein